VDSLSPDALPVSLIKFKSGAKSDATHSNFKTDFLEIKIQIL